MILASLLGAGLALASTQALDPEARAAALLQDDRYGFCHEDAYPLTADEEGWCSVAELAEPRCPSLPAACGAPRGTEQGPPGRLARRSVSEEPDEPDEPEPPSPPPSSDDPGDASMPAMGGVGQVLFWMIVVLAVVLIVRAIATNLAPHRRREGASEAPPPAADHEPAPPEPAATMLPAESDVDRLLAAARDAAARQRWDEAVVMLHAALLRRLDHEGLVHLHRSRTSGDYLRQLRAQPELHAPVRDALRDIDRAHFGGGPPSAAGFESILGKVRAIVQRVGSTSLLLLLLLGAGPSCDDAGPRYPWGDSPSGVDATIELLRDAGTEAGYAREPLDERDEPPGIVVLLQDARPSPSEWEALRSMVASGGMLVTTPAALPPWWSVELRAVPTPERARGLPLRPHLLSSWPDPEPPLWLPLGAMLETGKGGRQGELLLLRGDHPYAMQWEHGMGMILVLAEDRLLANASLAIPGHPTAVVALLGIRGEEVVFVDGSRPAGAADPAASIEHSHLTPALIQLLVLVGLLYLWRGARFGRPRPLPAPSRRAFVQHARAMAQHYARAGARDHAATVYCRWALERLREQSGRADGLSGLARSVAHRTGRDATAVMRLLVEAHGAAESGPESDTDGLRLVRELATLLSEERES